MLSELSSWPKGDGIRIAYLEEGDGQYGIPARTGEEDVLSARDVESLHGAMPHGAWQEQVVVVLHHVSESGEEPAEYRAETLWGVPNDVKVSGGSEDSAEAALNHLFGGMFLMGFRGTVQVDDASGESGEAFRRYDAEV